MGIHLPGILACDVEDTTTPKISQRHVMVSKNKTDKGGTKSYL